MWRLREYYHLEADHERAGGVSTCGRWGVSMYKIGWEYKYVSPWDRWEV